MNILDQIIQHKQKEVEILKNKFWSNQTDKNTYISQIQKSEISFLNVLQNSERKWPKLIAEVKKGSPSQGLIRADFNIVEIVKLYDTYADAMSILTDEKFFLGSLENLKIARSLTQKPLLRKDFILDEFQIYEARLAGADTVLLLASILNSEKIQFFLDLIRSLGMEALVEVHTETELKEVLKTSTQIIGINNRNLKDFSIDLENSNRLAQLIPAGKIIVSESGIKTKSDIRKISSNVDAILVGTAISKSLNLEKKIREITGFSEVKICGITNLEDAQNAVEFEADYLGFIFYENSPRHIESVKCAEIIKKIQFLNSKIQTKFVGVFVNKKGEEVVEIIKECGLDIVQLHGDEDSTYLQKLKTICSKSIEVWKAIRIQKKDDLNRVQDFSSADGIILDTYQKGNYGGTGDVFDWSFLNEFKPSQKVILAGGIDASNFIEAVNSCYPDVIDLSSKIEKTFGKKDLDKLRAILAMKKYKF